MPQITEFDPHGALTGQEIAPFQQEDAPDADVVKVSLDDIAEYVRATVAEEILDGRDLSENPVTATAVTNTLAEWMTELQAATAALADPSSLEVTATGGADNRSLADWTAVLLTSAQVVSTRTALKALDTTTVPAAYLTESGRSGLFVFRSGNYSALVTADTQEGIYIAADGIATTAGAWVRVYDDRYSVNWFGVVGDNSTDNATALSGIRSLIAALVSASTKLPRIVFPPGIYRFSSWPDFAFNYLELYGIGEVRLRYTGTGDAITFDAGSNVYAMIVDGFIVEAPSNAGDGIVFNRFHHGKVRVKVQGAGTTAAGIRTKYCVLSTFELTCSVNEGGWYNSGTGSAKPLYGLYTDWISGALVTIACTFKNPIMEGTAYGIYADRSSHNLFIGGTAEGCTDTGLHLTANSNNNRFEGLATEVNTNYDIHDLGTSNQFVKGYSDGIIQFGATAVFGILEGGRYNQVTILSGANNILLRDFRYNVTGSGAITDGGTNTIQERLRNYISGAMVNANKITSGTYTPILTAGANCDVLTAAVCWYQQIGDVVKVGGTFGASLLAAASTATVMGMSLPPGLESNFTAISQLAGVGGATADTTVRVFADTTNDRADFRWNAKFTSASTFVFEFSYRLV